MKNQSLLYNYLDLKLKEVIVDNEKRKRIIDEVITITARVQINDKSLKELMEDPEHVDISFSTVYPFIYAVIYKNDKNIYSLFVSKNFNSLLFVFELMAWYDVYNKSLDNFLRIRKDLPPPLVEFINDIVKTPDFAPHLRDAWIRVRREYIKKVEESMLDDIGTYLNVEDKEVIKNVIKEVSKSISSEKFPPPPYSIIHNNIHCGETIQFDRTLFFVECLNSSQKANWAFPELGDLWFEIFRYSLLSNQFSLQGLREVIRKFMSAQGDFKELFKAKVNKWAKKRKYEYQYPANLIFKSLMMLFQDKEPRRPISIDELKDFELLKGSPAWNIKKIIFADNNEIKRAVSMFKEGLFDASSKYFNYFFWENNNEILGDAHNFHDYMYRKGRPDQWMNLIRCWVSQFENEYMMDLALDLLKNILFIKTEEVCKEFNDWIVQNNLLENLKEKKVLLVYEPGSSVVNVLNRLRGQYLRDVKLTEHAFQCECTLNLIKKDGELVPTENKLVEYLKKDSHTWEYFTEGESKWTDIIYIEDNIGTGSQASEKIYALQKYIETAGLVLESVNLKYWSYVVADRNGLTEKLSTKGINPNVIEAKIDLQNPQETKNKLVNIDKLLQEKYHDEKDELKKRLENICGSVLKNAPIEWATERKHWLGYGGLGLLLVFEHGTPNNSLPLLWRDSIEPKELFALFPRPKSTEQNIVWNDIDSVLEKFQGKYL